ncbi:MAG: hypothetical protein C0404_13000 [Verrucomicrobia bacterium]|nr:hypothetical protein [Verrucomicrobiota bacterium]
MPGYRMQFRDQMLWMVAIDLMCMLLGSAIGVFSRFQEHEEIVRDVFMHLDGWFLLFSCVVVANYVAGNYRLQYTYSRFNLVVSWLFSMTLAVLMLSLTSYAWMRTLLGRGVLLLSLGIYGVISLSLKMLIYRRLFGGSVFLTRAVILGSGARAEQSKKLLESSFAIPAHKVVAFVEIDPDSGAQGGRVQTLKDGVALIRTAESDFEPLVRSLDASLIAIGLCDPKEAARIYPKLRRLRFEGIEVLTPLGMHELFTGRTPLDLIDEDFIMRMSMESEFPVVRRLKRMIDICVALAGGVALSPLILLTAIVVKISAPRSPVFYFQDRVGQFGRIFRIYKFRTMAADAEKESGPVWAGENDARITGVGRFLRKFRIDEIPQIFNVLKGDMSIVGPRPERPEIVRELDQKIPFYTERENLVPGLTGWAQVRYPYGGTVEDAARKLEYDLYYMKYLSLNLDLQIILSTLRIVIFGKERSS